MQTSIRRRQRAPVVHVAPPPPAERRGLRASAQRFPLKDRKLAAKTRMPRREWQDEAWEHFDDVPEIKYSTWFMGNVMAKIRLFPAVLNPNDPEAPPIPAFDPASGLPAGAAMRAQAELDRLHGPLGGRAEIMRAANMNLEIAGELFLIGFGPREATVTDPSTGAVTVEITPEEWGIYSVSQLTKKEAVYTVKLRPDEQEGRKLDPDLDSEPIRVWQRHARWSLEADCNMRGVLGECESLVLLGNSIKADAKSRMNAGYLLIPNELSTGPDIETEPEEGEEAPVDEFLQDLYDGMVDPIEDPSSAAAVAPTFIRGPADALKEFRHVEVKRTADQSVLAKITAAIERIARGMNLPVEVVMGHQQTTFANATQVKQDTFDDHFQPRCVLICDALTVGYLQPNLIAAGMQPEVAERIVFWFDPSAMIKQVNPVDSADKGIELDLLSDEAWRRAWGWSEDDAPNPVERLVRAVMHLRTFDPGISTAILELLGVPLDIPTELPGTGSSSGNGSAPAAAAAGIENVLARALAVKYGDIASGNGKLALNRLLGDLLSHDPAVQPALKAGALSAARSKRNVGMDLMHLDRDLRMRLLTAADAAMSRALEKAGNRLRSKAGATRDLARAGFVNSVYVASMLGRHVVAAAGFTDDDLISVEAWSALEAQFRQWTAAAQHKALDLAAKVVKLTTAQRAQVQQEQAAALDSAWLWLRDELHGLAHLRLYAPDPAQPAVGEHDPTMKVPHGLIRQALARAGGAQTIVPVAPSKPSLRAAFPGGDAAGTPVYVGTTDTGAPLGGVGLGETISSVLDGGGAGIDGWEWVYGPAYRSHPFEDHLALDGEVFVNFDDDVLVAGDWTGDYYFPGDHDGCACDVAPTILEAGAFSDSADASGLTVLGDVPAADQVIDEGDTTGSGGSGNTGGRSTSKK